MFVFNYVSICEANRLQGQDLAEAVARCLAAGPLIAAGHGYCLAAAVANRRRSRQLNHETPFIPGRFPAAFFMKIKESAESNDLFEGYLIRRQE